MHFNSLMSKFFEEDVTALSHQHVIHFCCMRQEVDTPYTHGRAKQRQFVRRSYRVSTSGGLAGVGVLAVALARTANGLNVIGRRDAATTQRSRLRNAKTRPRSAATRGRDPIADLSGEYTVFEFVGTTNGHFLKKDAFLRRAKTSTSRKIATSLRNRRQSIFWGQDRSRVIADSRPCK